MDAETAKTKNGSCTVEDVDYILLQQAYPENDQSAECGYSYCALAKKAAQWDDDDADHYMIYWDVIDVECDDESNACDWDTPAKVVKI